MIWWEGGAWHAGSAFAAEHGAGLAHSATIVSPCPRPTGLTLHPAASPALPPRTTLQIDATTLLALLVYHGASCFLPAFAGCRPDWLGSSLLPALTVLVPLQLLLLANRSQRWYSKHRDQLLMCTYVLLACHHALDLSSMAAAPGGMGQALALRVEASWCVVLGIILQVGRIIWWGRIML